MKNEWLLLGPNSPYRGGIAAFNDAIASEIQKKYHLSIYNYQLLYPPILFPGTSQFRPEANAECIGERILNSINPIKWKFVKRKIKNHRYEIILFPYWHPFFAPMLINTLSTNTINIMIGHNIFPHEPFPFANQLTQHLLKKVNGVITLGKSELKKLEAFGYRGKMTFHLSPVYPSYIERFQKKISPIHIPISKNLRKILFFGIIRPYKGLHILLSALKSEKLRDVALIIAGEHYGNVSELKKQIDELKERVYWINRYVSDEEVPAILQQCELVILPYLSATSTGVLPLAYCAGKPVIVTNVGGLPELVKKDYTGDIIPPNDVDALANSIHKWLFDESLQQRAKIAIPEMLKIMTFSEFLQTLERDLL